MALREIVVDGDPILRKKSRPVEKFDDKLKILLDDMAETMYYDNRGIGIAAVQVGILRRAFVVDVGDEHGKLEFINPEIYEREGAALGMEGCLSIPGEYYETIRPAYVKVKAQDRNGEWHEYEGEELKARCFCHELDHLDGVLFVERLNPNPTPKEEPQAEEESEDIE